MKTITNARTCILATLGPASSTPEMIGKLIAAGVNIFRLNFSHGDHDSYAEVIAAIRHAADQVVRPIGILQDLQGPKIRVRKFTDGKIELIEGAAFAITCDDDSDGDSERVGTSYPNLYKDIQNGEQLLLDDGRLELRAVRIQGRTIHTEVVRGGILSDRKGINLPGSDLAIPALSDKDVSDLEFGARMGVDWVAISFVRSRDDVQLARHYLQRAGSSAKLMAKIEKPSAVERFDSILEVVDGIMIARGDLGVEMPPEQVPILQKQLIRRTRWAGKPVVTATQMMESMITNPNPTRAEASDVANAIFDGTDAVMLSAETAAGKYPLETVGFMNQIALSVESDEGYMREMKERDVPAEGTVADSVAQSACQMAEQVRARVIVSFSSSGATALRVSKHRSPIGILAITPNQLAFNQLAMSWGVDAVLADDVESTDEMVSVANHWVKKLGHGKVGDTFVITAGVPFGVSGTTNLIRVETVT